MENYSIHLAPLPRRFPGLLKVGTIGYIAEKREWIRHAFDSFNFSFILKGSGLYRAATREWEVRAPCVITQWPGKYVEYGPHLSWEERYLILASVNLDALRRCGFADEARPVWNIQDPGPVLRGISELEEELSREGKLSPDRVDRICESLVMESLIAESAPSPGTHERAIRLARAYVEVNYLKDIDFDRLALEHGLSMSTFRRHWAAYVGVTPHRFVIGLRIRRACRLLVETSMGVGEIARAVRFDDPLYFSRRFRELTGECASEYRRRHGYPSFG